MRTRPWVLSAILCLLCCCNAVRAEAPAVDDKVRAIEELVIADLYTNYSFQGSLSDRLSRRDSKGPVLVVVINELISISNWNIDWLSRLSKDLTPSEKTIIEDAIAAYHLLIEGAESLKAYVTKKDKKDLEAYQKLHSTTWPKIQALVGNRYKQPITSQAKILGNN